MAAKTVPSPQQAVQRESMGIELEPLLRMSWRSLMSCIAPSFFFVFCERRGKVNSRLDGLNSWVTCWTKLGVLGSSVLLRVMMEKELACGL